MARYSCEAAPTEAETDFLLTVARESHGLIQGVVGWIDLAAPRRGCTHPCPRARFKMFVGVRPMLQDIADTYWIFRDEIKPALAAIAETGLCFDALIQPRHLSLMQIFANLHPDLKIVIDHAAAKPPIASREMQPWSERSGPAGGRQQRLLQTRASPPPLSAPNGK